MCGVLITSRLDKPFSHKSLRTLRRRGPDEIGFWSDDRVQVGHARLSVIGLDERGTQPMENHRHVLAFNGEIYNFNDIKRRLDTAGITVSGVSDAEVLLEAWTAWGCGVLRDLTGFWSFAIYDKQTRTLSLVRDQFGVKPLYYYVGRNGGVCVASLLGTIVETLGRSLSLDMLALSEYVRYQFTFGDKTFFQAVKKVLPGHVVEIHLDTGKVESRCYDDILRTPDGSLEPLTDEWVDGARDKFRAAVLSSTISDTSFTTFCSGGIDSSLITRLASPEIAYHCNFADPDCNETFFAKQAVDDTETRLFTVNAQEEFDLVDRLDDIIGDFDEPTIGSVIFPLDDLLAQVKRRYKVILTGTGGDELFGGYVRYQMVLGECFQDSYKAMFARVERLSSPVARFELTHRKGDTSLYSFYDSTAERSFADAFEACSPDGNILQAMLRFDRRFFLQGLLNIDDKMCGRHSLESRPSFLHQEFVRHVLRLDPQAFFDHGTLKPVLRRIAEPLLPRSIVQRTDKMGFTTPIGTFVNNSVSRIRERILSSPFRDYYKLERMNFTAQTKYSREVFGLLMLDTWLNHYAAPQ
jgi:asparagine synthase (glutamine-hydrolysing)